MVAYNCADRREAVASLLEDAGVEAIVVKLRVAGDRDQAMLAIAAVESRTGR